MNMVRWDRQTLRQTLERFQQEATLRRYKQAGGGEEVWRGDTMPILLSTRLPKNIQREQPFCNISPAPRSTSQTSGEIELVRKDATTESETVSLPYVRLCFLDRQKKRKFEHLEYEASYPLNYIDVNRQTKTNLDQRR